MTRLAICALVVLGSLGISTKAGASSILFSNFGPGGTYQLNTGWTVGMPPSNPNWQVAASFVPSVTAMLEAVIVPFADFGPVFGFPASQLSLSVTGSNALGLPGTSVLESFLYQGPFGSPAGAIPITLSSVLNPLLTAGTQYWIVATNPVGPSGGVLGWSVNSTGDTSATGGRTLQGSVGNFALDYQVRDPDVAFEVTGNPVALVPEPSSISLLLAGLSVIVLRSRSRLRSTPRARRPE